MASKSENRRINLYINGTEVKNDIKSIRGEYIKSLSQLNRMRRGSKEYYDQIKKVKNLKGVLDQHNKALGRTKRAWSSFKTQMGGWIAAGFGLAAAGRIFKSFFNNIKNFEKAASGLSALTGLIGDDLDWLKNKALGMNKELKESGVRMKQTATDILEAYKIVGSAKPELLKNKEALADVTKQAIILSEAAEMSLADAVKSLTGSLNQFNTSADHSERFINVMAAGAKAGAGNIQYLSEAIEKSGTTMDLMGVSFEKGIALIETAAPRFAQASVAGNSLDKVLLKMKEKGIGYTDGVFDMNNALLELKDRFDKGETSAQIFGVEHSKMAEILVQSIDDFNNYTKAVTGTNAAIEMASTNTNNLQGSLDGLSSNWTSFIISLNSGSGTLSKIFKGIIDMADAAVTEWRRWTLSDDEKAYEAKLKANEDFIKKFKEHSKLGQEDIEAEWNELLNIQLEGYKGHLEDLNDEDLKRYNEQLKDITDHLELIEQAKQDIAASTSVNPAPGEVNPTPVSSGSVESDSTRDGSSISQMVSLDADEVALLDEKLTQMEAREDQYVAAVADKTKWLTDEKLTAIENYATAAMQVTDAMAMFNQAAMNREMKAAEGNEEKQEQIRKKYAQKQKNMASIQAVIQGALGIVKTGANMGYPAAIPFQIAQGLQTIASIALIQSQQFADGNFMDVIGASDGRRYRAGVGSGTGMYNKPTMYPGLGLVGERGRELVFSNQDTERLLQDPALLSAISATIRGPQYDTGNAREIIKETTRSEMFTDPTMLSAINRLNENIEKGIIAKVLMDDDNTTNIQDGLDQKTEFLTEVNG